jgi:cell division protease FtsH
MNGAATLVATMSKRAKTLALWVVLILLFVAIYSLLHDNTAKDSLPVVSYATLEKDINAGLVDHVHPAAGGLIVTKADGRRYRTTVKVDGALRASLFDRGVDVDDSPEPEQRSSPNFEAWLAVGLVLLAVLAVIVVVLRRVGARSAGNLLSLKKTTARLLSDKPTTRFTDVGGSAKAKEDLGDILDFLKHPERWKKGGARLPRGVLLEGPPGCGKTLLARALAGEAGASFFEVSATEFVELFVGVGAARVRDLFEEAAKKAPAIVFIDELDAIGRRRGAGAASLSHQEREQTLNQLLVSMDGFGPKARVVVVAATNRADVLDPALLRPGRFDARLSFPALTRDERAEILRIHTRNKPLAKGFDLERVAETTAGFTGSELEHVANQAALSATRRANRQKSESPEIVLADFDAVIAERTSRESRFDKLDVLLIESASQLSQPTGKVLARASLHDGSHVEGEIVWVDSAFLKIRQHGGAYALVSKKQIRRLEAIAGTEVAVIADVAADAWAGQPVDAG